MLSVSLRQVFQVKIDEFRDSIAKLLGYSAELSTDRIRFMSVYSKSEEQSLLFTKTTDASSESTTLSLRRTPFVDSPGIYDSFVYYVQERGAIPAFLGDVTLRQWEQSTGQKRR